jgi:hypothetical protein
MNVVAMYIRVDQRFFDPPPTVATTQRQFPSPSPVSVNIMFQKIPDGGADLPEAATAGGPMEEIFRRLAPSDKIV